jgi:hypothetical protein
MQHPLKTNHKTKRKIMRILLPAATILFAFQVYSQPTHRTPSAVKGEPPSVSMDARGCPHLRLTNDERGAIAKFLDANPTVSIFDYAPSDYSDGSCLDTYQQWQMSTPAGKAVAQYPFASWGDFNHDGFLDFALFFVSKNPAVTHKWPMNGSFTYTYDYDWIVVVFQGQKDGAFIPVVVGKDRWAKALDGVIFHTGRQRIEYWFKSCGGSVKWTGSSYQLVKMKCND